LDKLEEMDRGAGKVESLENKGMVDLRDKLATGLDQFKRR
jgi:hypothetical protein